MPKTAKTLDADIDIEREMADISERIAALELEREALAAAPPPEWDALNELGTEQLIQQEQRRLVIPQLLRAARTKLLELRKAKYEAKLAGMAPERERHYQELEEAEAAFLAAEERLRMARAVHSDDVQAQIKVERRVAEIGREIAELRCGSSS